MLPHRRVAATLTRVRRSSGSATRARSQLRDNILLDVLDHPDIYDDAYDELDRREDEVPAPDDLDVTPPPGFEWLDERDEHGLPAWLYDPAKVSAVEKLNAELKDRSLTPGEQAERQALDRIAALRERLDVAALGRTRRVRRELTRATRPSSNNSTSTCRST
jgi:hypothetical protein